MEWLVFRRLQGTPNELDKTFKTKQEALDYILAAQKREHNQGLQFRSVFMLRQNK
jgi:hypothetical protein